MYHPAASSLSPSSLVPLLNSLDLPYPTIVIIAAVAAVLAGNNTILPSRLVSSMRFCSR